MLNPTYYKRPGTNLIYGVRAADELDNEADIRVVLLSAITQVLVTVIHESTYDKDIHVQVMDGSDVPLTITHETASTHPDNNNYRDVHAEAMRIRDELAVKAASARRMGYAHD